MVRESHKLTLSLDITTLEEVMIDSHTPLDEIITLLTDNPYVSELYLFGSRAIKKSDEFSDIDLTVVTPYPTTAEAYARKSLADAFGLSAVYTITNSEHEIVRTFCLSGMSPFHKIDIGFSLPGKTNFFPNSQLIFHSDNVHAPHKSIKKWAEPRAEHDYFDVMMGSLRYIKHRQRGENWQAYKCYRGFIEQLANVRAADSPQNIYKTLDLQNNDEILALFLTGDIREKERKYYEFIKNLAENKRLLPEFSRDSLKIWRNYNTASSRKLDR